MGPEASIIGGFLARQIFGRSIGELWRIGRRRVYNAFGKKTHGQIVEEQIERVTEELEEQRADFQWATDKIDEKEEQLSEKEQRIRRIRRIIQSLERKGINRKELIRKFERPIPILLVSYTRQRENGKESKFVRDTLSEKLDTKHLGAGTYVAPPQKVVQAGLTDSDAVEDWFEEEVYEGEESREAIIRHAALADMRHDVFWRNDFDFDSRTGSTVGEVIPLAEALEEETIIDMIGAEDRAALKELIQDGDMGFFASRWVEGEALDTVHANQGEIETRLADRLGTLDLTHLASASAAPEIAGVLGDYLDLSDEDLQEMGEGIVDEANIWKREFES